MGVQPNLGDGNMKLGETLDNARQLLLKDRAEDYSDDPLILWTRIVMAYNAVRGDKMETTKDAIIFMLCLKLVRESHKHKDDNCVDLAAYADILNNFHDAPPD